jgi:predicted RNA methylase
MIDQHYTSSELAKTMIEAIPKKTIPRSIADFSAGEGSLLKSAKSKWPAAKVFANDWSKQSAALLRRTYPRWAVSAADFLNARSVQASSFFAQKGKIDLVLINPPFSERGRERWEIQIEDRAVPCGSTIAFLANALAFLSPSGILLAILPDGCLSSIRDKAAWELINSHFKVEILRDNSRSAFSGVSARTSLVRISQNSEASSINASPTSKAQFTPLLLMRGQCQMHRLEEFKSSSGLPLVHSTQLRSGSVLAGGILVDHHASITGPAVLFPRVGRVSPEKVSLLDGNMRIVMSDCVVALPCRTLQEAIDMRKAILENWAHFASIYRGTGAPYLTLETAEGLLSPWLSTIRAASAARKPKQIA